MDSKKLFVLGLLVVLLFKTTLHVTAQTDNNTVDSLLSLSNTAIKYDVSNALMFAQKAEAAIHSNTSQIQKVRIYKNLATCYYAQANFKLAIANFTKALDFVEENSTLKGQILLATGNSYYAVGNLAEALKHDLEALKIFENYKELSNLINVYVSISNVYEKQNNFSKAIEFSIKAASIFEKNNDVFRTLTTFENIGKIYALQRKYTQSINYYNKALKLYKSMENLAGEAVTYQNIAKLFYKKGQFTLSKKYYLLSLKIAKQTQSKVLETSNLVGLGNSELMLNNYGEAEQNYKLAKRKAKGLNQKFELKEAYEGLALISKSKNNGLASKTFSMLSNQIEDSLFNDSVLTNIVKLQQIYDRDKTQKQIELLSQNEKLNAAQLEKERLSKNLLLAIISLFIILAFVFTYFYKKNNLISKSLEKQNIKLATQTEELDRLNKVKDRFFSIISHDLRNNLATMKLYFDLISNKKFKPTDNTELTKEIAASVENNIDLLENLLVWASSEIKGIPLKFEILPIYNLVQNNIELARSAAFQKNIEVQNQCKPTDTAFADNNTINLVLRNLIANAIKFTNDNGTIIISSLIDQNTILISVSDNGIGIDEDKLVNLFTQHQNPSTQGTANEKGTGLGLMLCNDFIKQNHGAIYAESKKGIGSIFTFELPTSSI